MCCGDANYCCVRKRCYSDEHIKRTNNCKDFDLNPIDALGENDKGYRPRKPKEQTDYKQIALWSEDAEGISIWPPLAEGEDAEEIKEQVRTFIEYEKKKRECIL